MKELHEPRRFGVPVRTDVLDGAAYPPTRKALWGARESLGLTQAEFAKALGFSKNGESTVRRWETDGDFHPTPMAWNCIKFLVTLETVYRFLPHGEVRDRVREVLPEVIR
jgi:DNA-binding XRE family transcriptional regulator